MPRPIAPSGLVKPGLDTRFHIDYEWWEQSGQDIWLDIQKLCDEYGSVALPEGDQDEQIDWIDPETAVVTPVSRPMYAFLTSCSQQPDFITERTALIEAVFRALLITANRPQTPVELAARTGRPAEVILQTLSGRVVHKGIRPYVEAGAAKKAGR